MNTLPRILLENCTSSDLTTQMAYDCSQNESYMKEYKKRHAIAPSDDELRLNAMQLEQAMGLVKNVDPKLEQIFSTRKKT